MILLYSLYMSSVHWLYIKSDNIFNIKIDTPPCLVFVPAPNNLTEDGYNLEFLYHMTVNSPISF